MIRHSPSTLRQWPGACQSSLPAAATPSLNPSVGGARAGEVAALVPGVPGAGADVVGIEQEGVIRMVRPVAWTVFAEQELLEEPGGMGAVPFRRAGVRHRLDQLILRREGRGPAF